MDYKILSDINQIAKGLRKDSCYIGLNGVLVAPIKKGKDETGGVHIVIPVDNGYKEVISELNGCEIDGKLVYDLYKVVKKPDVVSDNDSMLTLGNEDNVLVIPKKGKVFNKSLKQFMTFPLARTVYSENISETANRVFDEKTVEVVDLNYSIPIRFRLTKKLLKGYKAGDEVTIDIGPLDKKNKLFSLSISIFKKKFIVCNKYVIINF